MRLLVEVEARLDFGDEMPSLDTSALRTRIRTLCQSVQEALATAGRSRLLQSGLQVAIVGRPNVGKFRLLNAWSQIGRATVTDVPELTKGYCRSSYGCSWDCWTQLASMIQPTVYRILEKKRLNQWQRLQMSWSCS